MENIDIVVCTSYTKDTLLVVEDVHIDDEEEQENTIPFTNLDINMEETGCGLRLYPILNNIITNNKVK